MGMGGGEKCVIILEGEMSMWIVVQLTNTKQYTYSIKMHYIQIDETIKDACSFHNIKSCLDSMMHLASQHRKPDVSTQQIGHNLKGNIRSVEKW